jgi:hypothetical protein
MALPAIFLFLHADASWTQSLRGRIHLVVPSPVSRFFQADQVEIKLIPPCTSRLHSC